MCVREKERVKERARDMCICSRQEDKILECKKTVEKVEKLRDV